MHLKRLLERSRARTLSSSAALASRTFRYRQRAPNHWANGSAVHVGQRRQLLIAPRASALWEGSRQNPYLRPSTTSCTARKGGSGVWHHAVLEPPLSFTPRRRAPSLAAVGAGLSIFKVQFPLVRTRGGVSRFGSWNRFWNRGDPDPAPDEDGLPSCPDS